MPININTLNVPSNSNVIVSEEISLSSVTFGDGAVINFNIPGFQPFTYEHQGPEITLTNGPGTTITHTDLIASLTELAGNTMEVDSAE